jgi:hypothetical protein
MQSIATVIVIRWPAGRWLSQDKRPDQSTEITRRAFDHLLAAIETGRADVMTQVHLAGRRLDSQRQAGQESCAAMHAALGRGFLVLLNSHDKLLNQTHSTLPCRLAKTENGDATRRLHARPGQHAILMPRRCGQRQKDFVLDQRGNIKILLMRKKIPGVILQLVLRQSSSLSTNSSRLRTWIGYSIRLEAALAAQ